MKSIFKKSIFALLFGATLLTNSCMNLDEEIFSEVTKDNYYNNADEVIAALLRPWGHFCGVMQVAQASWSCNELSADAVAWPQKGVHGFDNGDWINLHRHQWTPLHTQIENSWSNLYMGIGLVNNMLDDLESLDFEELHMPISKAQAIAELKVCRAFFYWYVMDQFEIAPIVESIGDINPVSSSRAEIFTFIEKDLKENVPNLTESKTDAAGRVNKWGGYALLSRLYLNAEVYTGTPRWDDCIAACDEVIHNGGYQLDVNWNDPFKVDNDVISTENIWTILYDEVYAHGMGWYQRWLHYAHQTGWNLTDGPWNGLVTQPTFYDSFADNDKRKTEGFLIGLQYPRKKDANGNYYFDTTAEPLKGQEEYKEQDLVLVNYIKSMTEGEENSGARSIKYEIEEGARGNMNNDWVIFRLSEVIFNKAEALMRKNGNKATNEAVQLVNSVRQRAFEDSDWESAQYTTTTLTMDEFLAEKGREFTFEGIRRVDMIRFNKFVTTSWWDKEASNNKLFEIFPVPARVLSSNIHISPNSANALY
ncbi:MAG: RagB/SusD family nutrient uptake outer membrane protein [Tannerellaceae bacterium]|nr:RagB/SusD family nutrient uptake outer membrane protein [Tannerellaceae bacterium]